MSNNIKTDTIIDSEIGSYDIKNSDSSTLGILYVRKPSVFENGISGSLTSLSDGSPFLSAGLNITLSTGSNGTITINSTGGGGTAAGSTTEIQYNGGASAFTASNKLWWDNKLYISGGLRVSSGITGALNVLPDGSSYLKAGTNVTLSTGSTGQITINSITAGSAAEIQYNDGANAFTASNKLWWDNTNGLLNISGSRIELTKFSSDTTGSILKFFHSKSASNDDIVGILSFDSLNSSHQRITFAEIRPTVLDSAVGSEDGGMDFRLVANGTLKKAFEVRPSSGGPDFFCGAIFRTFLPPWSGSPGIVFRADTEWDWDRTVFAFEDNDGGTRLLAVQGDGIVTAFSGFSAPKANFTSGITGALNVLPNGSSYMLAGNGITLSTGSSGAITVATNAKLGETVWVVSSSATPSSFGNGIKYTPLVAGDDDSITFQFITRTSGTVDVNVTYAMSTAHAGTIGLRLDYLVVSESVDPSTALTTQAVFPVTPGSNTGKHMVSGSHSATLKIGVNDSDLFVGKLNRIAGASDTHTGDVRVLDIKVLYNV